MEYKEVIVYLILVVQGLIVYIFSVNKKETNEKVIKIEKKIEKIETGEFVEKIVKNVIYSPESRSYFKAIFNEALAHKANNDNVISLAILDHLEKIEKRVNEKN